MYNMELLPRRLSLLRWLSASSRKSDGLSFRAFAGYQQQCRVFHYQQDTSGHPQACARFKLKLEKTSAVANVEDKEEETEGEEGYLKSHPYRKLANVWRSKSELARALVDNVIHNDHGLFVTNKPFGVGVRKPGPKQLQRQGNYDALHLRGIPSCPWTLEELVPELRHLLDKPDLVLVRSTEKLTSGIAVFAENEQTGARFSKCVAASKVYFDVLYKYHVVTVLPPILIQDPSKIYRYGVTVKRAVGSDIGQPVIMYEYSINSVKRRDVVSVHCQSKLLQAGGGSPYIGGYLVELNTSSATKNFLRIYCADKLAPILGDHLYSSRVQTLKGIPAKIDPTHLTPGVGYQKLTRDMQERLQLKKPEDSLIVPTHVHLRSYQVRKFLGGGVGGGKKEVIKFEAPYPPHFKWTCEQLGIVLEADTIMNS